MLIAITGGIGSGKSAVLKIAESLGGRIISADEVEREFFYSAEYIERISESFPDAVVDGRIDRKKLAGIVFNDRVQLKKLNEIAHPLIMEEIYRRAKSMNGKVFIEIPLLYETGGKELFSKIWVVTASEKTKLERVKKRSGLTYDETRRIMKAQATEEQRLSIATDVIDNDGDFEALKNQVKRLYDGLIV